MNLLAVIGFLLGNFVLIVTVFTASDSAKVFFDLHGILIVLGGTFAAAATSYQIDRVWMLIKIFFQRALLSQRRDFRSLILLLLEIGVAYNANDPDWDQKALKGADPFLQECVEFLKANPDDFQELEPILAKRIRVMYELYLNDAVRFKSLAKYPPAMGLLGAVTGMITMLSKIGTEGAATGIGPAMAVALVATFYGIAFANFFLNPIAENMMDLTKEIKRKNQIILEAMLLISERKSEYFLRHELNSFLLPAERITHDISNGGTVNSYSKQDSKTSGEVG